MCGCKILDVSSIDIDTLKCKSKFLHILSSECLIMSYRSFIKFDTLSTTIFDFKIHMFMNIDIFLRLLIMKKVPVDNAVDSLHKQIYTRKYKYIQLNMFWCKINLLYNSTKLKYLELVGLQDGLWLVLNQSSMHAKQVEWNFGNLGSVPFYQWIFEEI